MQSEFSCVVRPIHPPLDELPCKTNTVQLSRVMTRITGFTVERGTIRSIKSRTLSMMATEYDEETEEEEEEEEVEEEPVVAVARPVQKRSSKKPWKVCVRMFPPNAELFDALLFVSASVCRIRRNRNAP